MWCLAIGTDFWDEEEVPLYMFPASVFLCGVASWLLESLIFF